MAIRRQSLRETITIFLRSESGQDEYGDAILVEDAGTDVSAAVHPLEAVEDEILRDTRVQRYKFIMAPGDAPTMDGLSRVEWRGSSFEILGEPLQFVGRNNEVHHIEFDAREIVA